MKILKIRRGYTTNSSASSEFIPPSPGEGGTAGGAAAANSANATTATSSATTSSGSLPATSSPGQAGQVVQGQAPQAVATSSGAGNGLIIGGFGTLVALAFVVERVVRKMLGRAKPGDDEE